MIDQEYIFQLLKKKKIQTISELSKVLGVNYHTLRYQLDRNSLRLEVAVELAKFLGIPIASLLFSRKVTYLHLVSWKKGHIKYELPDCENSSYIMFCILNSENIEENT